MSECVQLAFRWYLKSWTGRRDWAETVCTLGGGEDPGLSPEPGNT